MHLIGQGAAVSTAARIAQQLNYKYKAQMLAGLIVAGYDERVGGQVYNLPPVA